MTNFTNLLNNMNRIGYEAFAADMQSAYERVKDGVNKTQTFPPWNLQKVDENRYLLELAVAGFSKTELELTLDNQKLKVSAVSKSDKTTEGKFLHKGIATRGFERTFMLADNIEVQGSELVNGMLKIWLDQFIPEDDKPREIKINGGDED